ncbi:MAG: DUF4838 domain-containing protein [Planctomycetota bacterium]|nr:DUF4838 domain-containing protein [Planctomycetota bacterium]
MCVPGHRVTASCAGWSSVLLAVAAMAAGTATGHTGEDARATELAREKKALLPVVVGAEASAAIKATAAELAHYLGRMSGAEFKVEAGDGSAGIVVGRPADFAKLPVAVQFGTGPFEREDYVLRSHTQGGTGSQQQTEAARGTQGVYLLGASDLAVSHAAWDLLYRLGYRQFFPGSTWEVIPPPSDLKIAVNVRESPSFNARRIWYNWGLWGYNDEPYRQWCARNRAVKGFDLNSGHSYENIIAANKAEFDKHPEYYALVGGERKLRGDVKFCISNPDLRKLVADHAVRCFKQNPKADSISMDPSDGGNWCECEACGKMGGVSNRVLTLANEAAAAINGLGLGPRYVGMYAYNKHCAPPTIKVHPNVIVSATTAFITGGFTFDQVVEGWKAQGATIGVYDYLSVVDWDWNLPRGGKGCRPKAVADSLVRFHTMGARFYDAESGDCWGPCGLGYYVASRVLWDIREAQRVDALAADFLDKAFVSAKDPMREFYRLITEDTQRRSPSDIVGRMYRQLDAARRATSDPKVQERIDNLILYTRHAELYYACANGRGKVEDVARHDYRMRKTMMVHSYGLWCRLLSQKAALTPNHPLKSDEPFTPEELAKILADGIAKNQPVDPGFTSVEFSRKLVPAAARLKLPAAPAGSFPTEPQDHQQYYLWAPEGAGSIELKIRVQKVWANRMPRISLYSPQEVTLNAVATDESYKPDGKEYEIKLKTPHAGLHRVETVDGGDFTRITWPAGMPVTIESGIDTPDVTSHFRGPWTMYFYVPKGTKLVGGWASRVANWAPRVSGKLLDANGQVAFDFGKGEEGWFKVPVPEGQDGKLWKFANSVGQRLLMTVPPYLARSAEELLLPAEVVEADARQ